MERSLIRVDKASSTPIARQITDSVLNGMEAGLLAAGDKLPTGRDLAEALGIARGTVKSAYKKLENMGIVLTRQGSGSFIAVSKRPDISSRETEARALINRAVTSLREQGFADHEIRNFAHASLSRGPKRAVAAAIIYDNAEFLINFKQQLAGYSNMDVSIFIIETVTESVDPEKLLGRYDLIIVPTKLFARVSAAAPRIKDRMIEAAVSPDNDTIVSIAALPRDSRIGIICRTNAFLEAVRQSLLSFGFHEASIQSFFEVDYTIETYFPGGIDALISFGDAHIFTDPGFDFRNRKLLAKGGKIICYNYRIDSGSLIYIENRIKECVAQFDGTDERFPSAP